MHLIGSRNLAKGRGCNGPILVLFLMASVSAHGCGANGTRQTAPSVITTDVREAEDDQELPGCTESEAHQADPELRQSLVRAEAQADDQTDGQNEPPDSPPQCPADGVGPTPGDGHPPSAISIGNQ